MADLEMRWPDNAKGKYYVDDQCIDCDACRTEAPENFTRNDEEGYSYVYKQPETEEEKEQCEAAMEACPVEAIGDDGEDSEETFEEENQGAAKDPLHPSP